MKTSPILTRSNGRLHHVQCYRLGDIDIFKISYRSKLVQPTNYGNFYHIAGYMILQPGWLHVEKCGVRKNRPILRLFLVICFNGIVSMICAAIFVELERPEQLSRFAAKDDLQMEVERLHRNLTYMLQGINFPRERAIETLVKYSDALNEFTDIEDEIPWDMLAGAAFVNSVSSTTGYGDIVPVTLEGKLFTLVYALYGIPVFIWYVVKLGALFRVVLEPHSITEDLQDDKRFHPSIIGVILLVFMASVAAFISYMEDITYFNSVYACFITYSTIGFGDIDIYRISYRSNWFNLMIYGNCVHIAGYVILSAWVSSILDKCGIRRHR
ncbi:hypothetical protein TCAL_05802 [Tigriopus californicus]|uniref:Potassium channel domain-containing protein n=1 Tax=Tigriopus californicus TaxID=6832 RepID=A0A553PR43_TIGCA|nr:hypothetical protein TCAL_05802 [Tigriopus californicus]